MCVCAPMCVLECISYLFLKIDTCVRIAKQLCSAHVIVERIRL